VGGELGWLVWRHARDSRGARLSAAAVVVVGAALSPLAIVQAGGNRAAFIHSSGLASRVAAVPKQFLIGYATPHQTVLTILAAALALGLALGLRRSDRGLLALVALAAGLPALLAVLGTDYLITRNVIVAMVPLVALAGVAATRVRAGPALAGGLCAIGIVAFAGVEANPLFQRNDWRAVGRALASAHTGPRAVVLDPASGVPALEFYAPLQVLKRGAPFVVREIDVIDLAHDAPPPASTAAIPGFAVYGFTVCSLVKTPEFELVRYCVPKPVEVAYFQFVDLKLVTADPAILGGS
jgi:hypothetical protein